MEYISFLHEQVKVSSLLISLCRVGMKMTSFWPPQVLSAPYLCSTEVCMHILFRPWFCSRCVMFWRVVYWCRERRRVASGRRACVSCQRASFLKLEVAMVLIFGLQSRPALLVREGWCRMRVLRSWLTADCLGWGRSQVPRGSSHIDRPRGGPGGREFGLVVRLWYRRS